MKALLQILGVMAIIATVSPAYADDDDHHHHGGGAPATEIGASVLGMMLASGLAFYVRKRRK